MGGDVDKRELEFKTKWAELAAAKLRVENVDSNDLQAVRKTLLATVGGERLFQCWLEVNIELAESEKTTLGE